VPEEDLGIKRQIFIFNFSMLTIQDGKYLSHIVNGNDKYMFHECSVTELL
jgi:hypothetical protein